MDMMVCLSFQYQYTKPFIDFETLLIATNIIRKNKEGTYYIKFVVFRVDEHYLQTLDKVKVYRSLCWSKWRILQRWFLIIYNSKTKIYRTYVHMTFFTYFVTCRCISWCIDMHLWKILYERTPYIVTNRLRENSASRLSGGYTRRKKIFGHGDVASSSSPVPMHLATAKGNSNEPLQKDSVDNTVYRFNNLTKIEYH